MSWGIPVPDDENHVMYVWFDALTNYISTLGWFYAASANTKVSGDEHAKIPLNIIHEALFENYWVNGTPTQYCGKDNLRFQAAMWQAMLIAAGVPNSYQIVINGFITGEGGVKMSKSLGNVTDPKELVAEYGIDALRLFLAKEVSNFEDSPFTAARFKDAYNANLANGLGNLLSRTLTMAVSMGGVIKKYDSMPLSYEIHGFSVVEKIEGLTLADHITDKVLPAYETALTRFEHTKAADCVWELIGLLDRIIARTEPYKLVKTDQAKAEAIFYDILSGLSAVAKMLEPILPATTEAMYAHVGKYDSLRPETFTVKKFDSPLFPRKA